MCCQLNSVMFRSTSAGTDLEIMKGSWRYTTWVKVPAGSPGKLFMEVQSGSACLETTLCLHDVVVWNSKWCGTVLCLEYKPCVL